MVKNPQFCTDYAYTHKIDYANIVDAIAKSCRQTWVTCKKSTLELNSGLNNPKFRAWNYDKKKKTLITDDHWKSSVCNTGQIEWTKLEKTISEIN